MLPGSRQQRARRQAVHTCVMTRSYTTQTYTHAHTYTHTTYYTCIRYNSNVCVDGLHMHVCICGGLCSMCICMYASKHSSKITIRLFAYSSIHTLQTFLFYIAYIASLRLGFVRFAEFEFKWHLVFQLVTMKRRVAPMRVTIFRFLLHSAMYFPFRFTLSVLIVSCTLALCTQNNNNLSLKNNEPQLLALRYTFNHVRVLAPSPLPLLCAPVRMYVVFFIQLV